MARSQSAADIDFPTPTAEGEPASVALTPKPLCFIAPDHVSAIALSTGREIRVENGAVAAPDDLSDDERRQIHRAGFTAG